MSEWMSDWLCCHRAHHQVQLNALACPSPRQGGQVEPPLDPIKVCVHKYSTTTSRGSCFCARHEFPILGIPRCGGFWQTTPVRVQWRVVITKERFENMRSGSAGFGGFPWQWHEKKFISRISILFSVRLDSFSSLPSLSHFHFPLESDCDVIYGFESKFDFPFLNTRVTSHFTCCFA